MRIRLSVAAMLVLASLVSAQSPAARPEFEVASIKPNTSGTRMVRVSGVGTGRFAATNVNVRMLITFAYNVKNFEISGGTAATDSDKYDVEAKATEVKPSLEQSRLMLQTLLADRFKVMVHRETREMPIYTLLAGKNGLKLAESKEGGCVTIEPGTPPPPPSAPGQHPPVFCGGFMMGPDTLRGVKISMKQLVNALSNLLARTVIDETGYTGTFDVHLEFAREGSGLPADAANADTSRPSIFTALQEQLGLKLESQKGPAQILVIDHAEKASEN